MCSLFNKIDMHRYLCKAGWNPFKSSQMFNSNFTKISALRFKMSLAWDFPFLAHLSRRLEWAIVIAHRPLSVRPSVRLAYAFQIFDFFSRTAWWIFMKLGMHEVLMVPYRCCCFYTPRNEVRGGILESPCLSVLPSVCLSICRRARG